MTGFNLFRVNCLLNDSKSATFNTIIISIVSEFLYENKNASQNLKEIHKYINDYLEISVDIEFLNTLLTKSGIFIITPLDEDISMSLVAEEFNKVEAAISTNSIESRINFYLEKRNLPKSLKQPLERLLYLAVFENINSFSHENLKTLVIKNPDNEFSQEEIDTFNSFLSDSDDAKNKAIYNVFSRAVEFAILTTGKGIKEIKFDLFKNKTFILDTNILFRLLGVGGDERLESTLNLLKKCQSLGMNFEYTGKTHIELNNKLSQIIQFLNTPKAQQSIKILGDIDEKNPEIFNEDFILHYARHLKSKLVNNVDQYQRKITADYNNILSSLNAKPNTVNNIDEKSLLKFGKFLFDEKKKMGIRYGNKASLVDSYNVLLVQKRRGQNHYNFNDVNTFYLTSDRSLNLIVSNQQEATIPETILPSQLYILAHPFFANETNGDDYDEFINFIKKRKTGFKYGGSQVLNYINSIRELTVDVKIISESLILYSDIHYNQIKSGNYHNDSSSKTYKEVLQTILDNKIEEGDRAISIVNSLKNDYQIKGEKSLRMAKNLSKFIDISVIVAIIPLTVFLLKQFSHNLIVPLIGIVIMETLKFYLSSKFEFLKKFQILSYDFLVRRYVERGSKLEGELNDILENYKGKIDNNPWR